MAFIDAHREDLGIEPICRELAIAPSSYHEHAARLADPDRRPARARRDDEMRAQIQRVHDASFGLYGTRKVWHQLRREGVVIAKCTVERLMAAMGLAGVRRGKKTVTTVSNPKAPCPLDKVNREFRVSRPNALWVVDFTYVHTWAGFVYVAFVIDAYARRIVGWKVSNSATAGFVLDALEQAIHARRPGPDDGLIHHSDRGVQTTPSASPRPTSCRRSAAPATVTTMPWPRRSTASTRPRLSGGSGHGPACRPWKWQPCAGLTGSTTTACSVPSGTSRLPRPRPTTMLPSTPSIWLHDSNETASGKPGALQTDPRKSGKCRRGSGPWPRLSSPPSSASGLSGPWRRNVQAARPHTKFLILPPGFSAASTMCRRIRLLTASCRHLQLVLGTYLDPLCHRRSRSILARLPCTWGATPPQWGVIECRHPA
jgi:transposase InsO family protein